MSEDIGGISLEAPLEDQTAAPVGIVTDPTVPVQATEDEPEGTVEIPTGKVVPLQALHAERGRVKEVRGELEAAKQEIERMRRDVDEYAALKPKLQEAMPIIEAVRRRPDLVKMAYEPAPEPAKPAGPLSDSEAEDFAKDLDLYTPEGKPDLARAQRLATRQQALADRAAQTRMAPYEQQTAARQSQDMRQQIVSMKDAQGRTVDQRALDEIWNAVPPELAARPEVASVLYYAAKGYAEHHAKGRAEPAPAPVVSESLGSARGDGPSLTAIDERFMKAADIKASDFQKTAARFRAGHSNDLE